jgi:hypothetical protein
LCGHWRGAEGERYDEEDGEQTGQLGESASEALHHLIGVAEEVQFDGLQLHERGLDGRHGGNENAIDV